MPPSNRNLNLPLHFARGMAIFLVVLGHALASIGSDSVPGTMAVAAVNVIFTFHMPLFMFLSGFFATKVFVCQRSDFGNVVVRQFKRLMVVYFSYTTLALVAKLAAANYVNRPPDLAGSLRDLLLYPHRNPLLDLWFLYALFSIQMLFLTQGNRILIL